MDQLVPITDPAGLVGDSPVWFARQRYAAWSGARDFVGWVLWSHFADDDAEEGRQLWITLSRRMRPPYDFVLDLRRLESISRVAFERIREFAKTEKPGLRKMAILVGEETTGGAIQVGLFAIRPPSYPWRAFKEPRAAASWLERPDAEPLLSSVERLAAEQVVPASPLADVRTLLGRDPTLDVDAVARSVAQSKRALQRLLAENGTSFLEERERARITRAQELLREPEAKLDAVAAAIGCGDRRSLNRLFRRVTGESPAEFRARRGLQRP